MSLTVHLVWVEDKDGGKNLDSLWLEQSSAYHQVVALWSQGVPLDRVQLQSRQVQ